MRMMLSGQPHERTQCQALFAGGVHQQQWHAQSNKTYGAAGIHQATLTIIVQSQSGPQSSERVQTFCLTLQCNDSICNQLLAKQQ